MGRAMKDEARRRAARPRTEGVRGAGEQTWKGWVGLVLALKKENGDNPLELRSAHASGSRCGCFSVPLLKWIRFLKALMVRNPPAASARTVWSACKYPGQASSRRGNRFPSRLRSKLGSWFTLRPFLTRDQTASSVKSFSLKEANIQNIKHNIFTTVQ